MLSLEDFKLEKCIKAFFKSGKTQLIMKLYLPSANTESEEFNLRFNTFYDEMRAAYTSLCERLAQSEESFDRPMVLYVSAT